MIQPDSDDLKRQGFAWIKDPFCGPDHEWKIVVGLPLSDAGVQEWVRNYNDELEVSLAQKTCQ